ncbi:MuF-like minor capsid protein [Mycobacterium phage Chris]|uniref:MuF-like minor capsid protein n=1 Tax=Mycobacterium phage Chris TaxID=2725626 RepID=A0A6M3T8Q5_9CAUD|nr:head maturation protease [Mycobacterium phage Chris]QJD50411.1 MuF-like minor capsid protein [Mycobacterium phage Chris]
MTTAVPELQGALASLASRVGEAIDTLVPRLADASQREGMALITDAYPALVDRFLGPAGELTTQWYTEQPGGVEGFVAEPAALPDPRQLAANGRWSLLQADPVRALRGSSTRAVFGQSRRTVLDNVAREGVKWARYASEGACGFCRMLATRSLTFEDTGAPGLYSTKYTALHGHSNDLDAKGHDHCKCVAVPLRDGQPYDPPAYVHDWLDDYQAVSRGPDGYLLKPGVIAKRMETRGDERTRLHRVGQWLDAEDEHRHAVAYYERVDEELAKVLGVEPEAPAPKPKRKAKRTLDEVEAELSAAIEAGDEARIDKLIAEMDRIEERDQAAAAKQAAKQAAKEAEQQAQLDKMGELMEQGWDEAEAESFVMGTDIDTIRKREFMAQARADGHTGKSFEELLGWVLEEMISTQYWAAEDATNGVMIKRQWRDSYDPRKLWSANETTARKYMSEEMAAWFDEHGRVTRAALREAVMAGRGWKQGAMTADFLQ